MNVELRFGEWLEDQLRARGWTQAAFADAAGVSRTTVNSWVNGVQPPRRRAARDIARALNVDINEVLIRAGYPPQDPGYALHGDRPGDTAIGGVDDRVRFFASRAGALTEAEWQAVKAIIEQLAKDD